MPSASAEMHAAMERLFGDPIDDHGPVTFLQNAGYRLTNRWQWQPKPGVVTYKDMTQDEYDCLRFLIEEWDFDGLEEPTAPTSPSSTPGTS